MYSFFFLQRLLLLNDRSQLLFVNKPEDMSINSGSTSTVNRQIPVDTFLKQKQAKEPGLH